MAEFNFSLPTKDWHQTVTVDSRNRTVHWLMQEIFPTSDAVSMDREVQTTSWLPFLHYARKIEGGMFDLANCRFEYYYWLTDTVNEIQKKFKKKSEKIKDQQQHSSINDPQMAVDIDEEFSSIDNLTHSCSQETRKQSMQQVISSFLHAIQCRDANCSLPSCQKMKRFVTHTKNCKRKTHGGCPICTQLIVLCCYHAKYCKISECLVSFCPKIKQKFRQQNETHELLKSSPQLMAEFIKQCQQNVSRFGSWI
jgi:KIX domain/TAZ zinc finger